MVTLLAVALALVLLAEHPPRQIAARPWERILIARVVALPLVGGLVGAAVGQLIGRLFLGLVCGLAIAGILSPALFLYWLGSP
jgi:hypothetical protein